ncbi:MAG: hypothetical protein KGQ57_14725 [Burkholderiales bacterium]|nr:hypothetical protein [Burkholderiales bacterium]
MARIEVQQRHILARLASIVAQHLRFRFRLRLRLRIDGGARRAVIIAGESRARPAFRRSDTS